MLREDRERLSIVGEVADTQPIVGQQGLQRLREIGEEGSWLELAVERRRDGLVNCGSRMSVASSTRGTIGHTRSTSWSTSCIEISSRGETTTDSAITARRNRTSWSSFAASASSCVRSLRSRIRSSSGCTKANASFRTSQSSAPATSPVTWRTAGPDSRESFTAAETKLLSGAASVFALLIENARLNERELQQEQLRRDLSLAAEVQKRLLPTELPSAEIAEFSAASLPARSIGGDYYDFLDFGGRRLGIALADVSGKGIAAALIMSAVQASL